MRSRRPFFSGLKRSRLLIFWISALRNPNGSIVSSSSDLCASFAGFYSSLFSVSSTEFFVKFWEVLGLDLVDVLNSCCLSGSLSLSQRWYYFLGFQKRG